jgi:catechol 2,3-dioxygenase-like lactoylglutathione lyase family enzyme
MATTTHPTAPALAGADITVVSVPVSDQDAAARFYVEALGFAVLFDEPFGPGMRWLQLGAPDARCSIALVDWFEQMPPGSVQGIVLETPDIARDHAALSDRGVAFAGPPVEDPYGTHAEFEDPDGNGWILLQPPAGA